VLSSVTHCRTDVSLLNNTIYTGSTRVNTRRNFNLQKLEEDSEGRKDVVVRSKGYVVSGMMASSLRQSDGDPYLSQRSRLTYSEAVQVAR
jgi:hypothetical protein